MHCIQIGWSIQLNQNTEDIFSLWTELEPLYAVVRAHEDGFYRHQGLTDKYRSAGAKS